MHKDPVMLLVMFKDHEKVAEQDITNFTEREVADLMLTQEMQGRSWGFQLTSKEEMRERRWKLTDFHLKVLRDEANLGI